MKKDLTGSQEENNIETGLEEIQTIKLWSTDFKIVMLNTISDFFLKDGGCWTKAENLGTVFLKCQIRILEVKKKAISEITSKNNLWTMILEENIHIEARKWKKKKITEEWEEV